MTLHRAPLIICRLLDDQREAVVYRPRFREFLTGKAGYAITLTNGRHRVSAPRFPGFYSSLAEVSDVLQREGMASAQHLHSPVFADLIEMDLTCLLPADLLTIVSSSRSHYEKEILAAYQGIQEERNRISVEYRTELAAFDTRISGFMDLLEREKSAHADSIETFNGILTEHQREKDELVQRIQASHREAATAIDTVRCESARLERELNTLRRFLPPGINGNLAEYERELLLAAKYYPDIVPPKTNLDSTQKYRRVSTGHHFPGGMDAFCEQLAYNPYITHIQATQTCPSPQQHSAKIFDKDILVTYKGPSFGAKLRVHSTAQTPLQSRFVVDTIRQDLARL